MNATDNTSKLTSAQRRAQEHAKTMAAARAKAYAALAAAIRASGGTCTDDLSEVDGVRIQCSIREQNTPTGLWRTTGNGRLYISLGDYGEKVTLPEPKAGFGAKQAERIRQFVSAQKAQRERAAKERAVRNTNREVAARLRKAIGQDKPWETHGHALCVSQGSNDVGSPRLVVQGSEEGLLQAIEALRKLGFTY